MAEALRRWKVPRPRLPDCGIGRGAGQARTKIRGEAWRHSPSSPSRPTRRWRWSTATCRSSCRRTPMSLGAPARGFPRALPAGRRDHPSGEHPRRRRPIPRRAGAKWQGVGRETGQCHCFRAHPGRRGRWTNSATSDEGPYAKTTRTGCTRRGAGDGVSSLAPISSWPDSFPASTFCRPSRAPPPVTRLRRNPQPRSRFDKRPSRTPCQLPMNIHHADPGAEVGIDLYVNT